MNNLLDLTMSMPPVKRWFVVFFATGLFVALTVFLILLPVALGVLSMLFLIKIACSGGILVGMLTATRVVLED